MLYSPYPMRDYQLAGVKQDTVSWISREIYAQPLWNLYWLSEPMLDVIPGAGMNWMKVFRPVAGGLAAALADVNEDVVLRAKLMLGPDRFLDWFTNEDASVFDCWKTFGPEWPHTVASRATLALARPAMEEPDSNVVHVNFRRKA